MRHSSTRWEAQNKRLDIMPRSIRSQRHDLHDIQVCPVVQAVGKAVANHEAARSEGSQFSAWM